MTFNFVVVVAAPDSPPQDVHVEAVGPEELLVKWKVSSITCVSCVSFSLLGYYEVLKQWKHLK